MSHIDGALGEEEEEEEAENQFHRLADDVVVNIFDKLSDVKCLCRCFVVSRRFSSLVSRVQTVSVKSYGTWELNYLPIVDYDSPGLEQHLNHLIHGLGINFLAKLTHVRALHIELPSDFGSQNDSVFKWAANFTAKLDGVMILYAESLSKIMESEQEEEDETDEQEEEEEETNEQEEEDKTDSPLLVIKRSVKDAVFRLGILSYVVERHPMLESVTITDSKNKGAKLCLGGEKIAECRNWLNFDRVIQPVIGESWRKKCMNIGTVPVLELPTSGYVMKWVIFAYYKLFADEDSEVETAMVNAFAEEQGVFSEAAVQILKNHNGLLKNLMRDPGIC
ncbi:uncharacterized protein LOC131314510 [Rhododendron vialii]|uniref:uncharacterized protein LOC131314510 n=1 Tax=Rhododendron vialii TaxID=182163 RepID=UPI00265EEFC7|nr:uncharacterized protein LOC131314510 [Rhododendron vialii]